jgi:hypothetical protein
MTIQERIINITYKHTTRPISFVYNDSYSIISPFLITARVLYEFKDLIPDYQKYSEMVMPFSIHKDTEGSFEVPSLKFNFTIITIGHGTVEVELDNEWCYSTFNSVVLKTEIQKQIGINSECIELCNEDGEEINDTRIKYDNNKTTFYATVKSFEDEVLKKGYEILDCKTVLNEGETMRLYVTKVIGNYSIVQLHESPDVIVKRTPKTVVFEIRGRTKINNFAFGEGTVFHSGYTVSKIDNIEYEKEYAIIM